MDRLLTALVLPGLLLAPSLVAASDFDATIDLRGVIADGPVRIVGRGGRRYVRAAPVAGAGLALIAGLRPAPGAVLRPAPGRDLRPGRPGPGDLPAPELRAHEPGDAHDGQHGRDVGVQAQAQEVLGRIDPQRFLEDPEGRVPGHVQREQARRLDVTVMPQPDQERGQQQVEDQLVQERRVERAVLRIARRAEGRVDLQPPGQAGGATEQFLVEVVADAPDRLRHQQGGRDGVHELGHVGPGPVHPPYAGQGAERDAAPDPQAPIPDREHPVPVVRDVLRGGDVEIDPAADDPRGHRPDRHVADQGRIAAQGLPPALRDEDGGRDPDHVHQPVEMDVGRADMEPVHRRAGNEGHHGASVSAARARSCPDCGKAAPVTVRRTDEPAEQHP